jgi:small-conductance mechanosensitive channel
MIIMEKLNRRQEEKVNIEKNSRESAIGWSVILAAYLAIVLAVTTYILDPVIPTFYLGYLQSAGVAEAGFFAIHTISKISYRLSIGYSEQTAEPVRSFIRIAGAIIVIGFVISYLSQEPVFAASVSTIIGIVIGFAASNLIGNVIAGIYVAAKRPFRTGDRIKIFIDGRVSDVGLIYTGLLLDNGNEKLASNSSMVTTNIILRKKERQNQE